MHCTDGKGHKRVSVTTVNDKSYTREKFHAFCGFSMNLKSFPMVSNGFL